MEKDSVVLVLQSIVKSVVPLIEEDIDIDDRKVERDDREQKVPSRPAILREPMWGVISQASRRIWRRPATPRPFC
jgi:hypothetical protein